MISLKVIARLLDYPEQALFDHQQALVEALEPASELDLHHSAKLILFIRRFCARPLLDVQAEYCELFDRGRATSLLLFEHVHGESRDRGQAMVDLMAQYREAGLEIDSRELPDFLPLYLEYLASRSKEQAAEGLQDIAPILALLGARLLQRESPYAVLFDLLLVLSGSDVQAQALTSQVAKETRDDTPQALDAVWEEEQVKFLGEEGCASAQQAAHQRRFAGAVAPQYLDLTDALTGTKGR
ncbi:MULTISPECIES: nitrate reductase molybdenum cofactor assembly chaperone [Serratia]|jgi:nitrate reductase delta subunit|uniref:Redox enzyme maturation protein NarJ n=1 Tax=Serratia quinivorans TaxID=137545 RepID=A0A2X2J7W4_9GAMM|nr:MULTISPECIES: nitrate reductase molybdenum cofactor assembly chaperone [Serratia]MCS4266103.1 nitrate reductase delta subunit [Serratia sp. BIGb0163]QBX64952.1 nitrate reductase molybdenum cofactor assembly chaperone [Serratia quinivorans]RYM56804.1 nitrate reductase molybdenum cofactor assembly chaperone [Serratia proteamaculans]CAI1592872.1 Redox enzyme maturation protein NarJ [Serratia quinivorans]CAI1690509.1 Redox enzyme maturation protein NarJ [Serratia quinivorans]